MNTNRSTHKSLADLRRAVDAAWFITINEVNNGNGDARLDDPARAFVRAILEQVEASAQAALRELDLEDHPELLDPDIDNDAANPF